MLNRRRGETLSGQLWFIVRVTALLLFITTSASAFTFEQGEVSGALDITLGYGTAYRTQDAASYTPLGGGVFVNNDHPAASNVKSDLEFGDKGFVSSIFRMLAELDLTYKNIGLKSTASYSYDAMIMNRDRDLDTDPSFGVPFPQSGWSDDAEDASGSVPELLDAYLYGTFFEDRLDLRIGKQVINWGEGLFFMDGVATQVPLNINKLVLPGSEIKEAFIGIGAVRAQMAVTNELALDGYVQWEWEKNQLPGSGTFYGEDYLLAPGAEQEAYFFLGSAHEAEDHGQWGVSARYFFSDVELGLYYSRYHSAAPMFNANLLTGQLYESFSENQDMVGASLASTLGDWTMNIEVSCRPDRTIATVIGGGPYGAGPDSDGRYWTEADTANIALHGIWMGGASVAGIDSRTILLQLGMDYVDYDGDYKDLQVNGGNTDAHYTDAYGISRTNSGEEVSQTAWGIAAQLDSTWQAVAPNLDLTLSLFGQYDFHGNSHLYGNFTQGRLSTSIGLTANYGAGWEASLTYARMDYDESNYETQDTVNFQVNYKF